MRRWRGPGGGKSQSTARAIRQSTVTPIRSRPMLADFINAPYGQMGRMPTLAVPRGPFYAPATTQPGRSALARGHRRRDCGAGWRASADTSRSTPSERPYGASRASGGVGARGGTLNPPCTGFSEEGLESRCQVSGVRCQRSEVRGQGATGDREQGAESEAGRKTEKNSARCNVFDSRAYYPYRGIQIPNPKHEIPNKFQILKKKWPRTSRTLQAALRGRGAAI